MKDFMRQDNIKIRYTYLPLLFLILLIFLNGFYNSLATSFGFGYPYTTFLFDSGDLFADFFNVSLSYPGPTIQNSNEWLSYASKYVGNTAYGGISVLEAGANTHFHIPPLITLIFLLLRKAYVFIDPAIIYFAIIGGWISCFFIFFIKVFKDRTLLTLLSLSALFCYPSLFIISRGNLGAAITSICIVISLVRIADANKNFYLTSIFLAAAINSRPNSIIFLGFLFAIYNYKVAFKYCSQVILVSIVMGCLTLYLSHYIYPDYTYKTFAKGISNYFAGYAIGDAGLAYGSSALGGAKFILQLLGVNRPTWMTPLINSIMAALILIGILAHKAKNLNSTVFAFVLCSMYTLSSAVFGDYHLLIFIIPVLLGLLKLESGKTLEISEAISIAISLLMLSPKNYVFLNGLSIQVLMNPLLLFLGIFFIYCNSLKEYLKTKPS
jgi:hypothetical protein